MSDAEKRALELFPPKHIRETWVRTDPDINAPLRAAYVKGWQDTIEIVQRLIEEKMAEDRKMNHGPTVNMTRLTAQISILKIISNLKNSKL